MSRAFRSVLAAGLLLLLSDGSTSQPLHVDPFDELGRAPPGESASHRGAQSLRTNRALPRDQQPRDDALRQRRLELAQLLDELARAVRTALETGRA